MWSRAIVVVIGIASCSDGRHSMVDGSSRSDRDPATVCGPEVVVATAEEVYALLGEAATWPIDFTNRGHRWMPVTADIKAGVDLTLDATAAGQHAIFVAGQHALGGMNLLPIGVVMQPEEAGWAKGNYLIVSAGSRFRLRAFRWDDRWFPPQPTIQVHLPCRQDCPDGTSRCPDDNVCYGPASWYCMQCTNQRDSVCACAGQSDGADCGFVQYYPARVQCSDVCSAGVCVGCDAEDLW